MDKSRTRTWVVRGLAGLALVLVCVRLGVWQLDRNEQRSARNAVIEANAEAAPVPLGELVAPGQPMAAGDEWRQVEVRGRFDAEHELLLRLRPVDGQRGVHALTPLVTESGAAMVVDRGFVPADGAAEDVDVPPPPEGEVTVVARLRPSEPSDDADPASGSVRRVDLDAIGGAVPYPLYGAWGQLVSQDPRPPEPLEALPAPQTEAGPHLSYAVQWFLFAVIGAGGFVVLLRSEKRDREDGEEGPADASRRVDMGA